MKVPPYGWSAGPLTACHCTILTGAVGARPHVPFLHVNIPLSIHHTCQDRVLETRDCSSEFSHFLLHWRHDNRPPLDSGARIVTFSPEVEVDHREVTAGWKLSHWLQGKGLPWDLSYVVSIVTDDPCERCSLEGYKLVRSELAFSLVPEPVSQHYHTLKESEENQELNSGVTTESPVFWTLSYVQLSDVFGC
jgi:hypothetical protein